MSKTQLSAVCGVVFDLDDTLFSEREYCRSGFAAVAEWLKSQIPCGPDPAARMWELFETADRRHVFDLLLKELGCDRADLIPRMVECYRCHQPKIQLHDDAERMLDCCAGHLHLGLISDGPPTMQQRKVEALGLGGRLAPIILTGSWGAEFSKPHPRAFLQVQAAWGIEPTECVYIADNPLKDFVSPRQLGWRSVRVLRPDGLYTRACAPPGGEPDAEITSLDELELSI